MGTFISGRVFRWGVLLAMAASAGCTSLEVTLSRIKGEQTTDVVPGVASPAEKLATLKKIREKAAGAKPAEKEDLAAQLAAAYGDETDPAIRAEIVRAAAGYPTEASAGMVQRALGDADPDVRTAACEALGRWGDAEAVKLLGGVLAGDVDTDVRLAAVVALGQTGDRGAVAPLGEALEDPDPAMQYRAVQALREVTGEDLGNNVNQWRKYVRGEIPAAGPPVSLVQRIRQMF